MFCSCSPTAKAAAPAPPPPRPPPRTPEAVSDAARIAAALSGVPFAGAATPATSAKESSHSSAVDLESYGDDTPTAAPRDARHAPLRAVPGPPTHHLNDPLLFEECGDHEDDRRGESVL